MLAILDLVPKWVWAAIVVALSATSCKLKWDNGQLSIEIEKGKTYVAQLETSISRANEAATAAALANSQRVQAAESAARSRATALAADHAAATAELERLRMALNEATSRGLTAKQASLAPGLDYSAPVDDLLTVSRRLVEVSEVCDGHVNDIQTLMAAWPK